MFGTETDKVLSGEKPFLFEVTLETKSVMKAFLLLLVMVVLAKIIVSKI